MLPNDFDAVAALLAVEGLAFEQEWRGRVHESIAAAQGAPTLAVYLAEALRWTRHANRTSRDYIPAACRYIVCNDSDALEEAVRAHWRFGPEGLQTSLQAMREFYPMFGRENLAMRVSELIRVQNDLLERTVHAKSQGRLKGLGPWLFLGVFKIHLTYHHELLQDAQVNGLTMPLGSQAVRALRLLVGNGTLAGNDIPDFGDDTSYDGATSDEDFANGIANATWCMDVQRRLAESASSTVPRINNGLYRLGIQE